eukprot:gene11416-1612_t
MLCRMKGVHAVVCHQCRYGLRVSGYRRRKPTRWLHSMMGAATGRWRQLSNA